LSPQAPTRPIEWIFLSARAAAPAMSSREYEFAAVDDHVIRLEVLGQGGDRRASDLTGQHHDPHRARPVQTGDRLGRGRRPHGTLPRQGSDGVRIDVVDDAVMAVSIRRRTRSAPMRPKPTMPGCT
jgi:hypothetical protein